MSEQRGHNRDEQRDAQAEQRSQVPAAVNRAGALAECVIFNQSTPAPIDSLEGIARFGALDLAQRNLNAGRAASLLTRPGRADGTGCGRNPHRNEMLGRANAKRVTGVQLHDGTERNQIAAKGIVHLGAIGSHPKLRQPQNRNCEPQHPAGGHHAAYRQLPRALALAGRDCNREQHQHNRDTAVESRHERDIFHAHMLSGLAGQHQPQELVR